MSGRRDLTFEAAEAAQREFLAQGGNPQNPTGPIHQWFARRMVATLRRRFQGGDIAALMRAVNECARAGLVMPKWVAQEVVARFEQVRALQVDSWDDVLGKPVPKGKTRETARQRRMELFLVLDRVADIRATRKLPIDEGLFEAASESLGMSSSVVKNRFYEARRFGGRQPSAPRSRGSGRRGQAARSSKKSTK